MAWPQKMAEEATGIVQSGKLVLYDDRDECIIDAETATKIVREGHTVSVPSAGAGNWLEVFGMLGFKKAHSFNTCSSAGDWSFGIKDDDGWRAAWQENRYPYYGFRYSVGGAIYKTEDELNMFMSEI
jgi:hypothetical protein